MHILFFNPISVALAAYIAIAILLALVTQPVRLRMVDLGNELLADGRTPGPLKAEVLYLMRRSMSMRVAALVPVALLSSMLDDILGREVAEDDGALDDPRFEGFLIRYLASILACNPLLAIVSILLAPISMVVHAVMRGGAARVSLEGSLLRAVNSDRDRMRLAGC